MKALVAFMVIISFFGCAGTQPSENPNTSSDTAEKTAAQKGPADPDPPRPVKSPHGYIITKDYELGRFGGFVGDCTDDQNWPYFWKCQSENAGNGGFK